MATYIGNETGMELPLFEPHFVKSDGDGGIIVL
jgi:hypothetical protein